MVRLILALSALIFSQAVAMTITLPFSVVARLTNSAFEVEAGKTYEIYAQG